MISGGDLKAQLPTALDSMQLSAGLRQNWVALQTDLSRRRTTAEIVLFDSPPQPLRKFCIKLFDIRSIWDAPCR
jgi:hypothetical protein